MYYITGTILEDGILTAYGLYNVNERKALIVSKKTVNKLIMSGHTVVGFKKYMGGSGKSYIRKTKGYIWRNLPELNGKGEPEKEEYRDHKVLIGTNGFKEIRQYVTVNSQGYIEVVTTDNLVEQIKAGKISGVVITDSGRLMSKLEMELPDQWLIDSGFERDENSIWKRVDKEAKDKE